MVRGVFARFVLWERFVVKRSGPDVDAGTILALLLWRYLFVSFAGRWPVLCGEEVDVYSLPLVARHKRKCCPRSAAPTCCNFSWTNLLSHSHGFGGFSFVSQSNRSWCSMKWLKVLTRGCFDSERPVGRGGLHTTSGLLPKFCRVFGNNIVHTMKKKLRSQWIGVTAPRLEQLWDGLSTAVARGVSPQLDTRAIIGRFTTHMHVAVCRGRHLRRAQSDLVCKVSRYFH